MKTLKIKEIHSTIQGEGINSGTPVTLIRLAGCNIWSGREQDRGRDSIKGLCALWCDTDFRGTDGNLGGSYTDEDLIDLLYEMNAEHMSLVKGVGTNPFRRCRGVAMFTGGEPLLQLTPKLCLMLMEEGFDVLIETNGTQDIEPYADLLENEDYGLLWLTISPKPPSELHPSVYRNNFSELKLVYDWGYYEARPQLLHEYEQLPTNFYFMQPLDSHDPQKNRLNIIHAEEIVLARSHLWRLGLQSHKYWDVP
jgi:organic radical activating enzyme